MIGVESISPLAPAFLMLDFQVLYAWNMHPTPLSTTPTDDYSILIPIFNSPKFFRNKKYTDTVKSHVVLCVSVTSPEMSRFCEEMEKEGYRVFRLSIANSTPYKILSSVMRQDQQLLLLREVLPVVGTKYTVFLDGDSTPLDDLGRGCATLEACEYGLASVIVVPSEAKTVMQRLQDIEYRIAMVTRRFRPWLTSGACIVGRTDVLRDVMSKHSTFFYGGDIEVGRLAKRICKVGHINLTVATDVPRHFRGWFKQRMGWWAGSFRQSIVNFDKDLRSAPVWTLYFSLVAWGLLGFRLWDLTKVWYIPVILTALYFPLTLLTAWRFGIRTRWVALYPCYALFQTLVLMPLGFVKYVRYSWKSKSLGRFRV